jgi:hypothetical protein
LPISPPLEVPPVDVAASGPFDGFSPEDLPEASAAVVPASSLAIPPTPVVKRRAVFDCTPTAETNKSYVPWGKFLGVVNWQVSGVGPLLGIMLLNANERQ